MRCVRDGVCVRGGVHGCEVCEEWGVRCGPTLLEFLLIDVKL